MTQETFRTEFEATQHKIGRSDYDLTTDDHGEYIESDVDHEWQIWLTALHLAARAPQVAPEGLALRARMADVIHLLQFATITTPSEGDAAQALKALDDVKAMIAAAPPPPVKPEGMSALIAQYQTPKASRMAHLCAGVTYVCPEKDIECGSAEARWCATCPKRAAIEAERVEGEGT